MARTDQEIVDQTNGVARIIYASRGYEAVQEGALQNLEEDAESRGEIAND